MIHPRTLLAIRVLFCAAVAALIASASVTFRSGESTATASTTSNNSALAQGESTKQGDEKTSKTQPTSVAETLSPETLAKFQQARDLARESRFQAAIQLLEDYKAANPNEVVAIIQAQHQWANEILKRAKDQYLQGNLKEAQRLASAIPTDAIAYQEYIKQKDLWERNGRLMQEAIRLKQQNQPEEAIALLGKVDDTDLNSSPYMERLRNHIRSRIKPAGNG